VNSVNIIGRIGQEPESKTVGSSMKTTFSIAYSQKWKSQQGQKEKTNWFEVHTWGRLAELCGQYLSKGQLVGVSGQLEQDTWETQDGKKRSKVFIKANVVKFLQWDKERIQF
jgi:single-strand DNA-binding protein